MILNHLDQLEARIQNAAGITEEQKAELLGLLSSLRAEAGTLPLAPTDSVSPGFTDDTRPIETVLGEIQGSVEGFEASHPRLTQLTNQIAVVLSNMGI